MYLLGGTNRNRLATPSINKESRKLRCLKSVEQCFILFSIRLWILYFPFVIL
ncbi:hypothetical protein HanXRQr2_Chr17g0818531 [Helianthus annuus]|uniref:Uncharacterized protein n=1 Tax=Helianthus annuus TaxID=4232 RepID=A0A9K3DKH9_HELAN|nr:hypothetical protein HanXRQr2_Chr17g0818531 [Helianthus annuus]KAJ0814466.1 hypothetical protein HanPSC8_Chr17g0786021 [Helianthus annuus]